MENSTDALQIKINQAESNLSKETREAIGDVNWKFVIEGMSQKYNQEQLENLQTETELLLCGLIGPNEYKKELETTMALPQDKISSLFEDLDKLIFKKIQERLVARLEGKGGVTVNPGMTPNKPNTEINKPFNIQETAAIKKEEKKVITDDIPLPPYAQAEKKINTNPAPSTPVPPQAPKSYVVAPKIPETTPTNPVIENKQNIIVEKMSAPTGSDTKVSDYSSQGKANPLENLKKDDSVKPHDPYREAIE